MEEGESSVRILVQRTETARRTAEARAARLEAANAESAEQISRLEHLVAEFRKALFGKKSEKLSADERQLSFDDLGTAIEEVRAQPSLQGTPDDTPEPGGPRRRRKATPGVRFPAHLERITKVAERAGPLSPLPCSPFSKPSSSSAVPSASASAG